MSILIKGATMPTGCRMCHFKEWTNPRNGWFCPLRHKFLSKRVIIQDKRYDDCPLVEIPPHGRLIDADKVIRAITTAMYSEGYNNSVTNSYERGCSRARAEVMAAPTVIESEGE